jgi:protein N-terminal amidase
MFKDKADISRFVEDAETGRTVTWAREVAVRFHTYVIIGFPRVVRGMHLAEASGNQTGCPWH